MKICIVTPGKQHDTLIKDYIYEFEMRLSPYHTIEWFFPNAGDKKEEAKKIITFIKQEDVVFLLDEKGKKFSSVDLSTMIEDIKNYGAKRLIFIIGGAFGVTEDIKKRADKILSLSDLIFPHMLVRAILVEQLYRANTILSQGKYHHE